MSHEATNWAVKVRGISCTEARVLWHLADCHNPAFGCFPKQDYLADAAEIDVRSVRRCLDSLRVKGHINWIEQRDKDKRKPNRYSLGFEQGFKAFEGVETSESEPDNLSGSPVEPTGQECAGQPDSGDTSNRTPESSIELVKEPVNEPVNERERASEIADEDRTGTAAFQKRVQRLIHGGGYSEGEWPKWNTSAPGYVERLFSKLTVDERKQAEDGRDPMLAKCRREKSNPMPIGIYLRDKAWMLLSDADRKWSQELAARKEGGVAAAKPEGWAPAYGPAHAAELFRILLAGPQNPHAAPENGMWLANHIRIAWPRLFAFRQATAIHGGLVLSGRGAELMEFVTADSPLMAAWQDEFRRRSWPEVSVKEGMRGLYMPRSEPGMDMDEAVAAAIEAFKRKVDGDADAA